jgi:hypothetical protein
MRARSIIPSIASIAYRAAPESNHPPITRPVRGVSDHGQIEAIRSGTRKSPRPMTSEAERESKTLAFRRAATSAPARALPKARRKGSSSTKHGGGSRGCFAPARSGKRERIDAKGHKHPLGLREGTTENKGVCRALLSNLRARARLLWRHPPCDRRWQGAALCGRLRVRTARAGAEMSTEQAAT